MAGSPTDAASPAERGELGLRQLAQQTLSRAAGAPLVPGNRVRLLKDAGENFPAWLAAIRGAREKICFESYIFADDPLGREFAEALAERARAGVRVRVLYDWLGGLGKTTSALVRLLAEAGVQVRCFNPPRLDSPFGWLTRDHRKSITVDGRFGYVTGLCVAARWAGDEARKRPPWRDTGIEIAGPAVADIERAFGEVWAATGEGIPPGELTPPSTIAPAGDADVRVIATAPATAGLYRLDQLIASVARERLWLSDAYFVGTSTYVQALAAAARDGVDVRLLVPGASDLPALSPLSRAGYRPLLEAGVRVWEWNGPMMHAKTAVADSRWARVGSSNLNIASWVGNYELDAAIEDEPFASAMEAMYEADLGNATEIVLGHRRRVPRRIKPIGPRFSGSAGRAAAGALRLSNAVGAALTNRRLLGPAEGRVMNAVAVLLGLVAVVAAVWPRLVAVPIAILAAWSAISLAIKARRLRNANRAGTDVPRDGLKRR